MIPAFSFSLKTSGVEIPVPTLCGPPLGIQFFNGMVVKDRFKRNISEVVIPYAVFTKLSLSLSFFNL